MEEKMAEEEKEENKDEEKEGEEGKEKKKKNPLLIAVAVVAVLLLIAIGVLVYVLMSGGNEEENPEGGTKKEKKVQKSAKSAPAERKINIEEVGPILDAGEFIVNLMNNNGKRYLRTKISIDISGEELQTEIEQKQDILKDIAIEVLSSKQVEEIVTKDGKERLKDELVKALNRVLVDGQINNVYFTNFVIQ